MYFRLTSASPERDPGLHADVIMLEQYKKNIPHKSTQNVSSLGISPCRNVETLTLIGSIEMLLMDAMHSFAAFNKQNVRERSPEIHVFFG